MLIKGIALFVGLCFLFPYPCEHPQNNAELKQVIDLIKERTTQFTSVWCRGKEYYVTKSLTGRVRAIEKGKKTWESVQRREFEIAFTCDKKNFFLTFYEGEIVKDTLLLPEEPKLSPPPKTSSVIDVIKGAIEQKSKDNYQYILQKEKENVKSKDIHRFRDASYLKDSQTWFVSISEDKKEAYKSVGSQSTREDFIPASNMSPLNMVGRVGFGTEDNLISTWGISLSEFLDLPGPFHLHHEGEYTILWHRANYFEDSFGKEVPLSLDIWIDQKGDIRQIDYVEYYGRIWKTEDFQKCGYDGIINCMTPKWIEKTYFFDDYTMTSKGVRFPLKGREEKYYIDTTTSDGFQLDKDVIQGVISREEYLVKRCFSPVGVDTLYEFSIIPTSLKVNEPIPEDVFTAPPITEREAIGSHSEKNQFWNIPFRAMIFVGFGVMIVLVLMYLTHRYLGWSFF